MTTPPVIISRTVIDRAGNRLDAPMATYISEPSQRALIRARDAQAGPRLDRNRNEAMALLRVLEQEPRRERPAAIPDHCIEPEPMLNADFLAGLIAGGSFSIIVAGALYLGARL